MVCTEHSLFKALNPAIPTYPKEQVLQSELYLET